MDENQTNCTRTALLFAAEKYRRYADGLARFDDPISADLRTKERAYRSLSLNIDDFANFNADQSMSVGAALTASIDDMNRKRQTLVDRYQTQDAALVESAIREAYAAMEIVEARIDAARVAA